MKIGSVGPTCHRSVKEAQRWSGAALGVGAQSLPKRLRESIRDKIVIVEQCLNIADGICVQQGDTTVREAYQDASNS